MEPAAPGPIRQRLSVRARSDDGANGHRVADLALRNGYGASRSQGGDAGDPPLGGTNGHASGFAVAPPKYHANGGDNGAGEAYYQAIADSLTLRGSSHDRGRESDVARFAPGDPPSGRGALAAVHDWVGRQPKNKLRLMMLAGWVSVLLVMFF